MIHKLASFFALASVFTLAAATTSFGQRGSKLEIFGGGSHCQAQLGTDLGRRGLSGWDAGATLNLSPRFDVVAQFGGLYGNPELDDFKVKTSLHSLLFGIRFRPLAGSSFSPFAHIGGGPTRIRGVLQGFQQTAQADLRLSAAAGAGVDWRSDRRWGLRLLQVDWLLTNSALFNEARQRHLRVSAGLLVYPFRH